MASFGRGRNAKQWARFAMKIGLFLTDAKLWSAVNEQMRERAEDITDSMKENFREASSRLDDAQASIRGRRRGGFSVTGFLTGIGVGVAVGMLVAPVSGGEARSVILDKASDVKDKVTDFATGNRSYRSSGSPTGTTGD